MYFICVRALSACTPAGQKRESDLITDGVSHHVVAGNWTQGHLEEQPVLLTSKASLQTHKNVFNYISVHGV